MNKLEREEILHSMSILKGVKEETISDMALKGIYKSYLKEETLFLEGFNEESIFLVNKGRAIISRFSDSGEEKIIHVLPKGNFINEVAIDGRKTSTTVTINESTELFSFFKGDVLKWMENDFALNQIIIKSLTNKLRSSYRQIRNLGLKKTKSRIVSRLLKFARDYGIEQDGLINIKLNITHARLGAMVGTSRESVSRFLKKLEREGVIEQQKHGIKIRDISRLKGYL